MFYNDKFHRETLARGDESRWSFESVFPSFFAVFSLKFQHIDQTHSTEITLQNTLLNMQIVNKKGVGDSLCKIFHPKCFKTTNFDRFRYGVSLRYVFKISCQIRKYSDYAINIAINNILV